MSHKDAPALCPCCQGRKLVWALRPLPKPEYVAEPCDECGGTGDAYDGPAPSVTIIEGPE